MSSQLVDMNADGYKDILVGSFSGVPQLILGNQDGYAQPIPILDGDGKTVLIQDFWNKDGHQADQQPANGRTQPQGHLDRAGSVVRDDYRKLET